MASRIALETIQQVSERTDIVSLIGEYTRLERRGSDWWGCCPFHKEKTPSFHVVPERGMYHCFGCGQGGNAITFCMEMEKLSFADAVRDLAKRAGVEIIYEGSPANASERASEGLSVKEQLKELYSRTAGTFHYLLKNTPSGKNALEYLKSRGIAEGTIDKFRIGYSPPDRSWLREFLHKKHYSDDFLDSCGLFTKKNPRCAFFAGRLMFPIFDRTGAVVAFGGRLLSGDGPKYLNTGDLLQYKKGETLYAFNFAKQSVRTSRSVILCEGYMDVIAYHQCGVHNAVAPLGTALTEQQVHMLRPFVDTVYLSFDSDSAGRNATWKAILMCRAADLAVRIICLGNGSKDPAEAMMVSGPEILTQYINDAILDTDYILSDLQNRYKVGTPEGNAGAVLAFFPYIDVLKSDVQKESCLDMLCQKFNLKPEAVRRDFYNRGAVRQKVETAKLETQKPGIRLNAEIRSILAVISHFDYYPHMRSVLSPEDFEDSVARNMFVILEECYRSDLLSYDGILAKCGDTERQIITNAVLSGEYAGNVQKTLDDCIRLIRQNSLERKRERLVNRIRQYVPANLREQDDLNMMIVEKMNIDAELNKYKGMAE